jgi:hypothetical protein
LRSDRRDPRLGELAGAFQLRIFAMLNVAVIVYRHLDGATYRPRYVAPRYPSLQIGGTSSGLVLLLSVDAPELAFMPRTPRRWASGMSYTAEPATYPSPAGAVPETT